MKSLKKNIINSEGILQQCNNQIEGFPNHCLHFDKIPLILKPMNKFKHSLIYNSEFELQDSESPDFVFRNVKFLCSNLTNLIYLQNKSENIRIVFENCHFASEK